MDSILDYFISLQESEPAELPERAIERWNKRADFWEDARKKKEKGDERVISAINYLDSKGLLEKNYDVADIGCGLIFILLPLTFLTAPETIHIAVCICFIQLP